MPFWRRCTSKRTMYVWSYSFPFGMFYLFIYLVCPVLTVRKLTMSEIYQGRQKLIIDIIVHFTRPESGHRFLTKEGKKKKVKEGNANYERHKECRWPRIPWLREGSDQIKDRGMDQFMASNNLLVLDNWIWNLFKGQSTGVYQLIILIQTTT